MHVYQLIVAGSRLNFALVLSRSFQVPAGQRLHTAMVSSITKIGKYLGLFLALKARGDLGAAYIFLGRRRDA